MSVTKEQLDEIIKRHERVFSVSAAEAYRQVEAASKTFGCEAAQHIADRAAEIGAARDESSRSPIPAWDQAVNQHIVENRIRLPITTTCESCGELCLWCWWTGVIPSCGCIEDGELERRQAEFEAQHGGAVAEGEPNGQYEQAYSLFEEGWTIHGVGEQVGVPFAIAETISNRQLHDKAVEHHDPANCDWCRERMASRPRNTNADRRAYREERQRKLAGDELVMYCNKEGQLCEGTPEQAQRRRDSMTKFYEDACVRCDKTFLNNSVCTSMGCPECEEELRQEEYRFLREAAAKTEHKSTTTLLRMELTNDNDGSNADDYDAEGNLLFKPGALFVQVFDRRDWVKYVVEGDRNPHDHFRASVVKLLRETADKIEADKEF